MGCCCRFQGPLYASECRHTLACGKFNTSSEVQHMCVSLISTTNDRGIFHLSGMNLQLLHDHEIIFNIDNNCIYSPHLTHNSVASFAAVQALQQWHHSAPCCICKKKKKTTGTFKTSRETSKPVNILYNCWLFLFEFVLDTISKSRKMLSSDQYLPCVRSG